MRKALAITMTATLLFAGNFAYAGEKNPGSHSVATQINTGLQLALADAKANLDQALVAAGSDKAARKAALAAYKAQVKAVKKALGVK